MGLNLKLALRSTSDGKVHYTKEETGLCQQLVSALSEHADVLAVKKKVEVSAEVAEVLSVLLPNATSVTGVLRGAFGAITKQMVENKVEGFPKVREYSSVTIMFRGAMKELGVAQGVIDEAFPSYQGKKKSA